jgi:hypothetical protein
MRLERPSILTTAEELAKMGDARVMLATVPSCKAMSAVLGGMGVNGKVVIISASDERFKCLPLNSYQDVSR